MYPITKYALAAVAAVTLTLWQAAALGGSLSGAADKTQQITVRYADLDLNQPQDVKVLYQRIKVAATLSCGERELVGSHLPLPSWQHCVTGAVDSAVARLDRPALSAYHRAHTVEAAGRG